MCSDRTCCTDCRSRRHCRCCRRRDRAYYCLRVLHHRRQDGAWTFKSNDSGGFETSTINRRIPSKQPTNTKRRAKTIAMSERKRGRDNKPQIVSISGNNRLPGQYTHREHSSQRSIAMITATTSTTKGPADQKSNHTDAFKKVKTNS